MSERHHQFSTEYPIALHSLHHIVVKISSQKLLAWGVKLCLRSIQWQCIRSSKSWFSIPVSICVSIGGGRGGSADHLNFGLFLRLYCSYDMGFMPRTWALINVVWGSTCFWYRYFNIACAHSPTFNINFLIFWVLVAGFRVILVKINMLKSISRKDVFFSMIQ